MVKDRCGRLGCDRTRDQLLRAVLFGPGGRLPNESHYDKIFMRIDIKNLMWNVTKTTEHYGIKLRANARGKCGVM